MSGAPRCSDGSAAAGEQLAGSAPLARAWVGLEQDGPWGAKAFTASHLDPNLGALIEARAAAHDVRPVLLRRPGRHADPADTPRPAATALPGRPRHVLVAHTAPGRTWLLEGTVADPAEVGALDWAAAAAGDADAVRRSLPGLSAVHRPLLLVCTNGTRDLCCAVTGRPLALGLAGARPGQVWEVTHTSGHRFAPTAVLLPAGTLHGRLDVQAAGALLDAAASGRTVLDDGHRGRSSWPPPGQVAELAVRRRLGETGLDALDVLEVAEQGEHAWRCTVSGPDGGRFRVEVRSEADGAVRAESCGKAAVPLRRWHAEVHTS
ncbi:sucrase ferredoxin [Nocardioides mesophilus]|uniref:Sucrase ferredoxin n=1 Tax=Nocardioides mesophilus TaxID=433659 RepID=A0A7G9RBN0_9ACTN|nr:sucrase ferredoxin [Nocardioides mesophilus]QNN53005.1 sucrase ferredoxin [Nocardioides mesophilus]